jgi:hypothetical protein
MLAWLGCCDPEAVDEGEPTLGLVAAHSEGGVDYGTRETHAVLGSDCRLNRPVVIAWREPNAPWKDQPRGLGPSLVDPSAVSVEGDLIVGRTRLRHPGERSCGFEPWQLAPFRRYGLCRTSARPSDLLPARILAIGPRRWLFALGRSRLRACLGGRRRSCRLRAYPEARRRSSGLDPLFFGGKRRLVSRGEQAHPEDPGKYGETQERKGCCDRDSSMPGVLPMRPGGLPRFNSNRSRPGIIRQRSAGPCSEIGVYENEFRTDRPGGGLSGLQDRSDRE